MGHKHWRTEEVDYLQEKWGVYTIEGIAKKMKRSKSSVRQKAYKLKLGSIIENSDYLLIADIIRAFSVNKESNYYSTSYRKFKNAGLDIREITFNHKPQRAVSSKDFWGFANKNKHLFNFAAFEKFELGDEPKWVDQARKDINLTKRKWTEYEFRLLVSKVKTQRYTYSDLSKEFNRTPQAIRVK